MIGSWGRRPNVGNRPRFRSSRKCMRRWLGLGRHLFSARSRPSASSVLTTLDGGAAQGYVEVPPVERAIAMQLCPQGAAAWRGNPRLPSRACKFSSALTAKAYGAAGQAASALHAMALLQVHQAKALKQLHEGDADPGVLQELRTATDLALRATKVTARALGQTMSTLVVQERHLWLTLADMRESDKHRFLDSPISQAGLFGEAVEDFAQQFSAAQKQTEAFRHILPRRSAAVSTQPPAAAPPPARRRRRPPAASTSAPARPQQQPSQWPQHGAGRREAAWPASAPAKPVKCQGRRRPWDGQPGASGSCSSGDGDSTTPSPGGGPGGEFLFCSATGPRASATQNFIRAVSFFSGSQEGEDGSARDPVSTFPSPSLFASGQQGLVRGREAFSRAPCPAVEPGECCTTHSDPTSRRSAFRVGPLGSTALPHRGYVYVSPGPACTAPGGLARAPQAVSLAPEDHQTRLRDSVRPASSQVQGQSVHLSVAPGCPCLACRSRVLLAKDAIQPAPPAEMESGLYKGPYFIVPKKHGGLHPIWDLRVLNRALVKLPFKMLTQRRLFQCVRPFDWVAAIDLKDAYFHVSILPRFRFAYEGRAYQ